MPQSISIEEQCAKYDNAISLKGASPTGDSELVASKERIFLICDFVPPEFPLILDKRVHRVTESEVNAFYREFGFGECDYLTIRLQEECKSRLRIAVSNWLGGLAGHGYLFIFRRNAFGLTATAELQWIS